MPIDIDPHAASGPAAGQGFLGLDVAPADAAVVLVPVPFAATVSYGLGAHRGPAAILTASKQIDLFDLETGRPYAEGIAMLPVPEQVLRWHDAARAYAARVIEAHDQPMAADLQAVNEAGERVNAWLAAQAEPWLAQGKLVGAVGGDHSTPFALIAACARRWPGLGVLHVDAHADLRRAYHGFTWSHASIFWNVLERCPGVARLVGVAYRDLCEEERDLCEDGSGRVRAFYDPWLKRRQEEGVPWVELCAEVVSHLPQQVYVSFDIDGLDPSLCPHTGTPVPGGLRWNEATALVRTVVESGRQIVGFDLCEVAPGPGDPGASGSAADEWNQNVGARLLYKLCGFALMSRR